jgi:hypothetical protein
MSARDKDGSRLTKDDENKLVIFPRNYFHNVLSIE